MDLNKGAVATCEVCGAIEAKTAKELAEKSDIVMLCLTTSALVEKVVYDDEGILAGIKEVRLLNCECKQRSELLFRNDVCSRHRIAIAEGTSMSPQAAVDSGLAQNDVPVIFDYFTQLKK